jgi:hypothetical protein
MIAGASPAHPKSTTPVLIASIIGGPSPNFYFTLSTPKGFNRRRAEWRRGRYSAALVDPKVVLLSPGVVGLKIHQRPARLGGASAGDDGTSVSYGNLDRVGLRG